MKGGNYKKGQKIKELEEKIQALEGKEETKERKEKRNNTILKGWEVNQINQNQEH